MISHILLAYQARVSTDLNSTLSSLEHRGVEASVISLVEKMIKNKVINLSWMLIVSEALHPRGLSLVLHFDDHLPVVLGAPIVDQR